MKHHPECSPFNITVKAYNDVGGSNISNKELILGNNYFESILSIYTLAGIPNMDYCMCIQKKGTCRIKDSNDNIS